jgi:hypothetical protein
MRVSSCPRILVTRIKRAIAYTKVAKSKVFKIFAFFAVTIEASGMIATFRQPLASYVP